ncbi:expressed unknown protein [Seminavis robusta]|uniref:Uncharacterized protein n=1 Tax=Seminavis robusta TaxID=568900 RepID=A0A9N8EW49_9STRA|nr:expressed unknown protein [Seminavis robusta]|eukprot:Sro1730_g294120.1 n/a (553) ;mRNA; r:13271-15236
MRIVLALILGAALAALSSAEDIGVDTPAPNPLPKFPTHRHGSPVVRRRTLGYSYSHDSVDKPNKHETTYGKGGEHGKGRSRSKHMGKSGHRGMSPDQKSEGEEIHWDEVDDHYGDDEYREDYHDDAYLSSGDIDGKEEEDDFDDYLSNDPKNHTDSDEGGKGESGRSHKSSGGKGKDNNPPDDATKGKKSSKGGLHKHKYDNNGGTLSYDHSYSKGGKGGGYSGWDDDDDDCFKPCNGYRDSYDQAGDHSHEDDDFSYDNGDDNYSHHKSVKSKGKGKGGDHSYTDYYKSTGKAGDHSHNKSTGKGKGKGGDHYHDDCHKSTAKERARVETITMTTGTVTSPPAKEMAKVETITMTTVKSTGKGNGKGGDHYHDDWYSHKSTTDKGGGKGKGGDHSREDNDSSYNKKMSKGGPHSHNHGKPTSTKGHPSPRSKLVEWDELDRLFGYYDSPEGSYSYKLDDDALGFKKLRGSHLNKGRQKGTKKHKKKKTAKTMKGGKQGKGEKKEAMKAGKKMTSNGHPQRDNKSQRYPPSDGAEIRNSGAGGYFSGRSIYY